MMKSIKRFYPLLFLLLFVTVIAGCNQAEPVPTPTAETLQNTSPTTEYLSNIIVEGEVVAGDFVNLRFKTGGVVDEVLVNEGDIVEKGQVIARVKGKEQYQAQIASVELALLSAQQSLDDLLSNADVNQADARLALAQAEKAYDDAQEDWQDVGSTKGSVDLIELAHAEYILAQNKVDEAERAYAGVQDMAEEDEDRAEVMSTLNTARVNRNAALAKWNYLKSRPDNFEEAELEGALELAKANLDDARQYWDDLVDGVDPDELAISEARVEELQIRLDALHQNLYDLQIISPLDGIVVINDLVPGEIIPSGTTCATVADNSTWYVETTDLTELEVLGLKKAMPVTVTFDAIPDIELSGEVDRVKEIGISKQGDITYTVVVKLNEWDDRLLWKMTASVSIQR